MIAARAAEQADRARRAAGLFEIAGRGLLEVRGADRVRWLDGMLTNDVTRLAPGPDASGCYAMLLTHQGRIVADLHVTLHDDAFWLDVHRDAMAALVERLEHHIIADDVALHDASSRFEWLGVEGCAASAVVTAAAGRELALAADCWAPIELAGSAVAVVRWGTSGSDGYRLLVPAGCGAAVAEVVAAAGRPLGIVEAGSAALEVMRVEAGIPRFGAELDASVLPAEAGLERAISQTKGCYIGQEVVARMASRGRSSHRLVGLRFDTEAPPVGAAVRADAKEIGEVTSVATSARLGPIALAFVRSAHAVDGARVQVGESAATVADLPFVAGR